MATSAETRVNSLETALASGAGVVQVTVDGQSVRYDRNQALAELSKARRQVAREGRSRPAASRILLGGF